MSRRLLVLGAGGFLGRSLAQHVVDDGGADLVLHYRTEDDPGSCAHDVETHTLDLLTCPAGAIVGMIDRVRPDVVVNCTGLTVGQPDELRAANVDVVARLIGELDGRSDVHLVHFGSAAEYGIQPYRGPVLETTRPVPRGAYSISKLGATRRLQAAASESRISVTVLRLFNPVGRFSPTTTLPGIAARKIDHALRRGAGSITLGPLDSWRDYVDVRDIARAVLAVADTRPPSGLVLNVGRGEATATRDLVAGLAAVAGYSGSIVEDDTGSLRSQTVDWQCADVEQIKRILGWSAIHPIDDSLADLWSEVSTCREFADD
jgi:nucleoside-diphosphate-sugar epimerase